MPRRRTWSGLLVTALAGGLVAVAPTGMQHASALPSAFATSSVASVVSPTAIEQLPDGRLVVLQQGGQLRIIDHGVLSPTPALDIAVCAGSERGFLGVTVDPDFLVDRQIYLYWTRSAPGAPGGCVNRVSRFSMPADRVDPTSEVVLVDNISSVNGNHNGGDLAIGKDGYLYVSVGDAGRDPRGDSGSAGANDAAQDLSLLDGKILRVDRITGAAAPDNPLVGAGGVDCRTRGNTPSTPSTPCAELYAWGLRNPWRIAMDPNSGPQRFFINDVGQSEREEVDLGAAGANYGWNIREGQCPQPQDPPCAAPPAGLTDPVLDYPHSGSRAFITAGAFIPDGVWPADYDGGYLFADGGSGEIFLRRADDSVDLEHPFATGLAGIADMAFVREPTGLSLYVTLAGSTSQSVRRISFADVAGTPSVPLGLTMPSSSTRIIDTRLPAFGADPLLAGTTRYVATGVDGAVTRAVLVNIAYVTPSTDGYLTAWAGRTAMPATANVNARAGEVVSNQAVVPVDADGGILLFSNATAHVVIDLIGTFDVAPTTATVGRFAAMTPVRIADTRLPADGGANRYTRVSGTPYPKVDVPVLDRHVIPGSVSAVALVVTAISPSGPAGGFVTATPGGSPWSGTANLNIDGSSDIRPNSVVVAVGPRGDIDLHLFQVADVVVDLVGWFTDSSSPTAPSGLFVSIPPTREVDTRVGQGFGRLSAGSTASLDPGAVPAATIGLAQNIAIVGNDAPGFITPFPGGPVPLVAAGNVIAPAQVRSIQTFTATGPGGTMSYFSYMATDLVVDVTGFFVS